jgi:hypothetical protein
LKEKENFEKTYGLFQNEKEGIMTDFLNSQMPGFKVTDPIMQISPLFASRNPDAVIRMNVLNDALIPCTNLTLNKTNCPKGFVLEPMTGKKNACRTIFFMILL